MHLLYVRFIPRHGDPYPPSKGRAVKCSWNVITQVCETQTWGEIENPEIPRSVSTPRSVSHRPVPGKLRINMKPYACIFAVMLLHSIPSLSQDTLSLEESIRIGLEQNFDIRIARNDRSVAENNHTLGNAGFLPAVGVDGALTKQVQNSNQVFVDGRDQVVSNAQSSNLAASASVDWVIFDGAQMFVNYQQLGELKQAEAMNTEIVIENKVAEISNAYYTVVLEKAQQDVFQQSLEVSQQRLDIAEAKYKVGKASKLEYLTAQVDYNADKSALIRQNEALYNAKVELNRLLNRPPDTEFNVPGKIDPNLQLSKEILQAAVVNANPSLLLAQQNQNIAYLETKRLQAQYYPRISLNAGYSYNSLESQAGFIISRRSNGPFYGITGTWNIFDGFNRKRVVQNARIEMQNADLQIESTRQSLLAALEKSYKAYTNSIVLVELEQANLEVAKENTQIALERYRLGGANNLELREVQQNAVEAESRLINAIYDTKLAEIELVRLSGQMVQSSQ